MYDVNTHDVRRFFAHVWQARFVPHTLNSLQQKALKIVLAHPEYATILDNVDQYLDYDWQPHMGQGNPFLHLSLHLSIQEQVGINQPFGIHDIYTQLCAKYNDNWLQAEHDMIEALAETLWEAQRFKCGLDVNAYMTRLRRLVGLGSEDNARINPHEVPLSDVVSE